MVVTKPPGEHTAVLHKPKEGQASRLLDAVPIHTSVQFSGRVAAQSPMLLPGLPGMKSE